MKRAEQNNDTTSGPTAGRRRVMLSAVASAMTAVALLASACSSSGTNGGGNGSSGAASTVESSSPKPTTSGSGGTTPADLVPADIKSKGSVTIAEDANYAPVTYAAADGKTLIGIDGDLRKALEPSLGIKFDPVAYQGPTLFPALQAQKVRVLGEEFSDLPERRKVGDFVDFIDQGNYLVVAANKPVNAKTLDDLCGHKIASSVGDEETVVLSHEKPKCAAMGKPLDNVTFPGQAAAVLALKDGRVDGYLAPNVTGAYLAQQSKGALKVDGGLLGPSTPAGWVLKKGDPFGPALLAAYQQLYSSGQLKTIFDHYGLGNAIIKPGMNLGG